MMWINLDDYFGKWTGHPDATDEVVNNAEELLEQVNGLMNEAFADGVNFDTNPSTTSYVAGVEYGGFRPQSCTQGAPKSSHKLGKGVDVFDGYLRDGGKFTQWCFTHQDKLKARGLYMEHPSATKGANTCWCHLTNKAPNSGNRVFYP